MSISEGSTQEQEGKKEWHEFLSIPVEERHFVAEIGVLYITRHILKPAGLVR